MFLDLPLSGIRTGSLKYNPNKQWHEVTCDDNSTSHPRRFVFSLKPEEDNSKQARDFNAKLEAVFEEIIRAADPAAANAEEGERKEEEVAVLSPLGKEVVQEMTSGEVDFFLCSFLLLYHHFFFDIIVVIIIIFFLLLDFLIPCFFSSSASLSLLSSQSSSSVIIFFFDFLPPFFLFLFFFFLLVFPLLLHLFSFFSLFFFLLFFT